MIPHNIAEKTPQSCPPSIFCHHARVEKNVNVNWWIFWQKNYLHSENTTGRNKNCMSMQGIRIFDWPWGHTWTGTSCLILYTKENSFNLSRQINTVKWWFP